MRRFILLLFFHIAFLFCSFSQNSIRGKISTENEQLAGTHVQLTKDDSIIASCISDANGEFMFESLPNSKYILNLSFLGFKSLTDTIYLSNNYYRAYSMEVDKYILDQVNITSDRSSIVKGSPQGSIYYLSADAKNQKNIFSALKEIPKLNIDIAFKTISLNDGSRPLIMINGIERESSSINMINPQDIDEIEVIEVLSAKHLKKGITSAINIKTKKKKNINYKYLTLGTMHNPTKATFGLSDFNLDLGNNKYSFYLIAQQFYFHNNKSKIEENQFSSNLSKLSKMDGESSYNSYDFQIGGDLHLSAKDYLLYSITYSSLSEPSEIEGEGVIHENENIEKALTYNYYKKYKKSSFINTYNAFYQHSFFDQNKLEVLLRFNLSGSKNIGTQKEQNLAEDYNFNRDFNFLNNKKTALLNFDYTFELLNNHKFDFGYRIDYQWNKINQKSDVTPPFYYKELNNYIYLDVNKSYKDKFFYSLSAGYMFTSNKSAEIKNSYKKLSYSAIFGYDINKKNRLTISNNQYMSSPPIGLLNPYNTSTDSLAIYTGNPFLEPTTVNNTYITYSLRVNKFTIEPKIMFKHIDNYIQEIGSVKDQVYIKEVVNYGNYKQLQPSIILRYNLPFGYIGTFIAYNSLYLPSDRKHHYISGNLNFKFNYKKASLMCRLDLPMKTYSNVEKSISSPESEIYLNWNISSNWDVNLGSRWISGRKKFESWTFADNYSSFYSNRFKDRYFTALLGVRYSFSNKGKRRSSKKLSQDEEGINLLIKE